jgi:DNA repair exonuclease SbcCD ATPase subunit
MINIKNITLKNFLSVGAVSQSVVMGNQGLTLVLGENLDQGGSGSRNGVGKSSILSALSYALYGQALTNIRKDNLINVINKKNMVVSVEFEKDNTHYRIERGRKPNFFRYYVDDKQITDHTGDESQGESRDTQAQIDQVLGISFQMFRQIICLNTYAEPFLSMGAARQREIIEELMGITLLSQKAENLKELIKATKLEIEREEFQLATIRNSNQKILRTLSDLQEKVHDWNTQHAQHQVELTLALDALGHLDVDGEISAHEQNSARQQLLSMQRDLATQLKSEQRELNHVQKEQQRALQQYVSLQEHSCPTCGQAMHDQTHAQLLTECESQIQDLDNKIQQITSHVQDLDEQLTHVNQALSQVPALNTTYESLTQALNHKNSLMSLQKEIQTQSELQNPYVDQQESLQSALQDVSMDNLNQLTLLKDHQEFLLRLLTNKDSFIRKRIIDQNITYLNHRLSEYLNHLGISHTVKFSSDLGVEINYMGQDMDFANLSRGESTRVSLSLSWAFRDMFEIMHTSCNLLMIDEILDQGTDQMGVERALEILKLMARDRNKSIFLISHREELVARVTNVITVTKENGFTTIQTGSTED